MKILVSKRGRERELVKELKALDFEPIIGEKVIRVRVNRRSNKRIEKRILVLSRLVFCDIDEDYDFKSLRWLQSVWRKGESCIEVPRDQVDLFINTIEAMKDLKPDDIITIPTGSFAGQQLKVQSVDGSKIRGLILYDQRSLFPVEIMI